MPEIILFSYGSILLPKMTTEALGHTFTPYKSVFISGYKLIIQHAKSKRFPDYHYIMAKETKDPNDIVAGFLVKIPTALIKKFDAWEGIEYERVTITCFDRNLKEIKCQMYKKKWL